MASWDDSNTHEDDEIEALLRGAAGRLVLLYLPTYSPWLNTIELLWRHFRREVTHCELFPTPSQGTHRGGLRLLRPLQPMSVVRPLDHRF